MSLLRCVLRLPDDMLERVDEIASVASVALVCDVSRAAVIRAALTTWLDLADEIDPKQMIEAIRVAMVKRGRKAR
jgi:predicted transcriptional regulator